MTATAIQTVTVTTIKIATEIATLSMPAAMILLVLAIGRVSMPALRTVTAGIIPFLRVIATTSCLT
jgi:hypothetical protein